MQQKTRDWSHCHAVSHVMEPATSFDLVLSAQCRSRSPKQIHMRSLPVTTKWSDHVDLNPGWSLKILTSKVPCGQEPPADQIAAYLRCLEPSGQSLRSRWTFVLLSPGCQYGLCNSQTDRMGSTAHAFLRTSYSMVLSDKNTPTSDLEQAA